MKIIEDPKLTKPMRRRSRIKKSENFLAKPKKEILESRKISIFIDPETEKMIVELRRYGHRDAVIAKAVKFLYDKDQAALRISEAIVVK